MAELDSRSWRVKNSSYRSVLRTLDISAEALCPMEIREARFSDTNEAVQVLRRSISELCFADHKNDPTTLSDWLENKTPEDFRSWLALPEQRLIVAVMEDQVVGVAAARDSGEITLNYVSPDHRGCGVSTALVDALEAHLIMHGVEESRLTSTVTAMRFYLKAGYKIDAGQQEVMQDRPLKMRKRLLASEYALSSRS